MKVILKLKTVLDFVITMDLVLKKIYQNHWNIGKKQVIKIIEDHFII